MLKPKKSSHTSAHERRRQRRAMVTVVQGRPPERDGDRGATGDESDDKPIDKPNIKILTKHQVLARVPLSYPSIWSMMKKGTFPRSRKLSEARVGWVEAEIDNWIANLPVRAIGNERKESA